MNYVPVAYYTYLTPSTYFTVAQLLRSKVPLITAVLKVIVFNKPGKIKTESMALDRVFAITCQLLYGHNQLLNMLPRILAMMLWNKDPCLQKLLHHLGIVAGEGTVTDNQKMLQKGNLELLAFRTRQILATNPGCQVDLNIVSDNANVHIGFVSATLHILPFRVL